MAEVVGHLREDRATWGEKEVLKRLRDHLPKEFRVYVECPLRDRKKRLERFPDFIVVANFGVVILEVKDWVQIDKATPHEVWVRRKNGNLECEKNPVFIAKEYAFTLLEELRDAPRPAGEEYDDPPWGYAVVFPNFPLSLITQLRNVWGEPYVLSLKDLEPPLVTQRLRQTLPVANRMLRRSELERIRAVIWPVVYVEPCEANRPAFVLDEEQERIIAEPPRAVVEERKQVQSTQQVLLEVPMPEAEITEVEEKIPRVEWELARNASIRLVRGVAGSGKTLVLVRRAQYLAALYPEWRICVLTYNRNLASALEAQLKGLRAVRKVTTFHAMCKALLASSVEWKEPSDPEGWIRHHVGQWPIVQQLGVEFVSAEISWIKEMRIMDRESYLKSERKGRGHALRASQREQIYDLLEAYRRWLQSQGMFDWADVPYLVLDGMDEGKIDTGIYDAILIDEAQDFAPVWIEVVKRLIKPKGGLLFLADDPSQSIYRFYSWLEKGVPVVGRTRWLRVPYRNTREIYEAAYEVIRYDETLKRDLARDGGGIVMEPELAGESLRRGRRPELRRFSSPSEEFAFIRTTIEYLLGRGYSPQQIAVLHRRKTGVETLKRHLRGLDVPVETFHSQKGLEYEVVFLSQLQEAFAGSECWSEEDLSQERRLVYMAMTRARELLYLNYEGSWPKPLEGVLNYVDRVLT